MTPAETRLINQLANKTKRTTDFMNPYRDNQQLFIGASIHYVSFGTPGGEYAPTCRAALVTDIVSHQGEDQGMPFYTQNASVAVLNPTGLFFKEDLPHSGPLQVTPETPDSETHYHFYRGGTWHHMGECEL